MRSVLLMFWCILLMSVFRGGYAQEPKGEEAFKVQTDQFADIAVLRYRVPGFEQLTLKQKTLLYYLYQAALSGRDIIYDQNYKHNLLIRKMLEGIVKGYSGDRGSEEFKTFMTFAKRVWFSNGIHHHYSSMKFEPGFTGGYFNELVAKTPVKYLPVRTRAQADSLVRLLSRPLFDPEVDRMLVNQSRGADAVAASANNFYEGLTKKEVEDYYQSKADPADPRPVSIGLNSKLLKQKGKITEKVWKVGGMYTGAIEQIVKWLSKAATVAENKQQEKALRLLVKYYQTGDLRLFDEYSIEWVKDTESVVDVTNGFIETYGDPMNHKATYESVVSFKDPEASKRIDAICKAAQWFEDHSPIPDEFKKKNVKGISARVITVVVESGDASPSTPIGINLPNAPWIRKEHGSKSVNLGNIVHAYNLASSQATLNEFAFNDEEIELAKKHGALADNLHTDLHEVIGHASGQMKPGIGTPRETLKNYASTIEEARADLIALYYILDPKLIEIGVMPSLDVGKAAYNKFIRNGLLTQLQRIKPGENIEEAHMRNRQLIASWVMQRARKDSSILHLQKNGKTFFVIKNYDKVREHIGALLQIIQRVSSEGDYTTASELVENYGVFVDGKLHSEVLGRFAALNVAPYRGFINPVLSPVMKKGVIADVKIEYPEDFVEQMLFYGKHYSFLPVKN